MLFTASTNTHTHTCVPTGFSGLQNPCFAFTQQVLKPATELKHIHFLHPKVDLEGTLLEVKGADGGKQRDGKGTSLLP